MTTAKKYNALIKQLHTGLLEANTEMQEQGIDVGMDAMAGEVAESTLFDEPWITELLYLNNITDTKGRLADDIYSGSGLPLLVAKKAVNMDTYLMDRRR